MANEPEKLGKYNIVGKLGKGAMGEVYKGHDPVLNRHVAIKVIGESLDVDADLVERFRREAKMAAQLNHPNIITIYDFVEDDGNLYIVMELLDGQDLKDLIKSGSPLTVDQILGIMEQIADGLGFAHDNGMVHRDLKPANIHMTKKGQIKILDFGLVHESSSDMTKTGHIMGTPNYMSPEQVQGLKVDPRSDIFSLGAVFYELLTRKKPFSADSIHATMFKVVQGEREPLAQYTHLPGPLVSMVDQALDANPEGRFEDGNDLREHLRTVRRQTEEAGGADSTMASQIESTIVTPSHDPGSHPSHPSHGSGQGSEKRSQSTPGRSGAASSASASRGGTMRRREMTGTSMGANASGTPVGLYIGAAVLVVAAVGGLIFFAGGSDPDGPSIEELNLALAKSQQQLMAQSLEQREYGVALERASEILADDPQNAEALRVQSEAQQALADIEAAVGQARAALERGATAEAADALSQVLALDPSHPLGAELHDQLNQHFQSQAEGARAEMEQARRAASSAGANSQAAFRQAERQRDAANGDFNRGEYTNAAQKFLGARDQYRQSQSTHQQAETSRRAQADRQAARQSQARQNLEQAESEWNRSQSQPAPQGMTALPSYRRAMSEEAAAKQLASSGDLAGAARAYDTARSYLETAQSEHRDAEARRTQADAERTASVSTAPTTTAPPANSIPSREQEEAAVLQVLSTYEQAIESENIDLFRQAKPNLTPTEAKRLTDSFEAVDSHEVDLAIDAINVRGDSATVATTRKDIFVVRGRSQNGNSRKQTFVLEKSGGRWIITQIQ